MPPQEQNTPAATSASTAEEDIARGRSVEQTQRTSQVSEPRLGDRTMGAQRLEYSNRLATKLTDGLYEDPEQARHNLQNLDDAGRERLKDNPSEIGALRSGVDPSDVNTRGLVELSKTYDHVNDDDRRDLRGYHEQADLYKANQDSLSNTQKPVSQESQLNQSLSAAPAAPHYLQI